MEFKKSKINKTTADLENVFNGDLIGDYDTAQDVLGAQVNWKFKTR